MSSKTYVIGQDKNYEGKLSKQVVEDVISKFKKVYEKYSSEKKTIEAFELNGGEGLTAGAKDSWNSFKSWGRKRGIDVIYNTSEDMDKIKLNLRNRLENKNKNMNQLNCKYIIIINK